MGVCKEQASATLPGCSLQIAAQSGAVSIQDDKPGPVAGASTDWDDTAVTNVSSAGQT